MRFTRLPVTSPVVARTAYPSAFTQTGDSLSYGRANAAVRLASSDIGICPMPTMKL